jgi:hypothetical protein
MIRSLTPEVDRMRCSNFLTVLCLSLVLISCSNSPTQKPPNDLRKFPDDPQSIFIEMMNYMLPMEVDGITMLNVFPEGEKGIVFPLVGDIPIPENLDGLKTDMLNNMFSGMARQQMCLKGTRALFESGVYVKFRFRNKTSNNQIDVIVDEKTCQYDMPKPEYKSAETDSAISQTEPNNSIKSTTEKYEFVLGQVSWSEAQEQAAEMGGYLACPNSYEEAWYIKYEVMPYRNRKFAWIGLTDEVTEGKWLCNGSEVDIEWIQKVKWWRTWLNKEKKERSNKKGLIPRGFQDKTFVDGFVVEWD